MIPLTKSRAFLCSSQFYLFQAFCFHPVSSFSTLVNSVQAAVESKTYSQIPNLISDCKEPLQKPNPFSFLSTMPHHPKIQIIDEMLQSFISIRPRNRPKIAYSCLLSHSLQNPHPLPISFAIIQCILRSGCSPIPQTRLSLSNVWLNCRRGSDSVSKILLEMKSIGYYPDTNTCNYLISSLCAVDELTEAVNVLKGMSGAGCVSDLESYNLVICKLCKVRKINNIFEMVKKLVEKIGLAPRDETILKVIRALRARKEIWRAVEVVELLEKSNFPVTFEIYELVLEGCLQHREYIIAGKVVMCMVSRGFIPYIDARLKVIEGLASVGELGFASAVRQKFAELNFQNK